MNPPQTTLEWREYPDEEPPVDPKVIERYVDRVLEDPKDVDIETFVIIEECNSWHAAYRKALERRRRSERLILKLSDGLCARFCVDVYNVGRIQAYVIHSFSNMEIQDPLRALLMRQAVRRSGQLAFSVPNLTPAECDRVRRYLDLHNAVTEQQIDSLLAAGVREDGTPLAEV